MARMTGQEAADKWAKRTAGATQEYIEGVNRVTEAPGKAAGRAEAKMLAKTTESIQNGTWRRRVEAVDVNDWKTAATQKGAGRIQAGVTGAVAKHAIFMDKLLQATDQGRAKIANMPSITLQDNIARMVAFTTHMASQKLKG